MTASQNDCLFKNAFFFISKSIHTHTYTHVFLEETLEDTNKQKIF